MEIIEIGAVLVERDTLQAIDEFQTFIKPTKNPILTDFCKQLTSITQKDVDSAPIFPIAITEFKTWLDKYDNFAFCSWGDYDRHQLEQDCALHQQSFPISAPHFNIKKEFSAAQGLKKRYGMAQALELANLPLTGTHHRGIDDARNMVKLMPFILSKSKIETKISISKG